MQMYYYLEPHVAHVTGQKKLLDTKGQKEVWVYSE